MTRRAPLPGPSPRHVSLVALPDAVVSTLFGIFDVMNAFGLMGISTAGSSGGAPIHTEIVGEAVGRLRLASGVPIDVPRAVDSVETTDIVIVPSVLLRPEGWTKGRADRRPSGRRRRQLDTPAPGSILWLGEARRVCGRL